MPPRRKAPIGPYLIFMLEYRRREQSKGKSFPGGMEQIKQEAAPHWNQLSDEQRAVYKERAKSYKSKTGDYGEKYTAQGVAFSKIDREKNECLTKQDTIRKSIAEMIQTASCYNALDELKMHFISFNCFCKTSADSYIPAEMAMVRYNLKYGVVDKLHEFINPGKLPLGLAYEARIQSEESHKLPVPPDSMGETDFSVLFDKLLAFIEIKCKKAKPFLLFTDSKEVSMVENIIGQLSDESKIQYNFLVCPLGELFFQLKRETERYGLDICTFHSKVIADVLLRKDIYEFTRGISCEFHEKQGNGMNCALSKVIRWSYTISDSCCLDLSIDLIAGRHLPQNANTTLCSEISDNESKICPSQSDRMSFVSTSDVTHVTLPKVQRIQSSSRSIEDDTGSTICSSRAGTSKGHAKLSADRKNLRNPFYNYDYETESSVLSMSSVRSDSPLTRRVKLEQSRQPRDCVSIIGQGRGSLLGLECQIKSAGSKSSMAFKGAGRGVGFSGSLSSVGPTSKISYEEDGN
ncbi:protein maelstrom homolog [Toxorhynchites rutilus septentrionalis]|uniref:protein maelstrom homolog n=1 Tax=Toxorhynchites rutilus septentrionalis TaxID=329112 RepID=UPI00247A20FF|nr:protein maelstrom homolog [Toxorhynchites rutilus septentrionalis]